MAEAMPFHNRCGALLHWTAEGGCPYVSRPPHEALFQQELGGRGRPPLREFRRSCCTFSNSAATLMLPLMIFILRCQVWYSDFLMAIS